MELNRLIIGERIKERRKAKGLTQENLAKKLGVTRQIISYYETSRIPSAGDLAFLAKELDTTTDYLLGLSDVKTTDLKIQAMCDYTGLSEYSVKMLHKAVLTTKQDKGFQWINPRKNKPFIAFFNYLLISNNIDCRSKSLYMAEKRYHEALELFNSLKSESNANCVGLNPCDHSKEYRLNCFEANF